VATSVTISFTEPWFQTWRWIWRYQRNGNKTTNHNLQNIRI